MNATEQNTAARQFVEFWTGKGYDGFDSPRPYIKFAGAQETVTQVRAWILGNSTHYSRSEAEVRAMFDEVNRIYRQAGMLFVVVSVAYTNMPGHIKLVLFRVAACPWTGGAGGSPGTIRRRWIRWA